MKLMQELSGLREANDDFSSMSDDELMDIADGKNAERAQAAKKELKNRGFTSNGGGDIDIGIDAEQLQDMDFSELLDKYIDEKKLHRTEGRAGLTNLAALCRALGYKDENYYGQLSREASIGDLINFLEDNSGAIEAVIEFIRSQGSDEWEDSLREYLM